VCCVHTARPHTLARAYARAHTHTHKRQLRVIFHIENFRSIACNLFFFVIRDRVCKVHLPKADAKDKVKRFQGLGVYINKVLRSAYRVLLSRILCVS